MVTKLKSRDNLKYLILVILICICSTVLLSRYGSFYEAGEKAQKEKADSMENVISDMGDGLAIGNCILDNEISGGREQSELLEEYGMSQFNLLKKYMEYGAFDRNGESLLKSTSDSVATRLLSDSDSIYGIRVAYTYDADGELSDIEVSGSRLTPEEEYEAEQSFLADVRFMEDAYGIELSGGQSMTLIYGMSAANVESYAENFYEDQRSGDMVIWYSGLSRSVNCMMLLLAVAAALLPTLLRTEEYKGKIFRVPFEGVILILIAIFGWSADWLYYPANILCRTVDGTLVHMIRPFRQMAEIGINLAMWSGIFLILCWAGACLCGIFTRKRAYWKEQTLTSMLIRWKNQHEFHMGKDFVSLVKGIMKRLKKLVRKQYDALTHIDFRDKTHKAILRIVIVNFVILVVVELVSLMCGFEFYALVIYSIVLFLILRKFFRDVQRKYQMLLHATNELAEGNLDVVIEGDAGVFMPIQKELCRIQQGFKKAVEEEVKNERMKTELVTNVSHDLRTPLTAIITYTDLLKNETDPEKQKEYIEVLERKSFRLKVLIEDLFEISKAASKSVKMNYMQVDLVGLIRQVELENDSKIQDAKLEFRWKLPDHKVIMWLDSEKTYRIFENLIVNITKYAMAQTRVYIEMKEFSDKVSISMKNVSATELDFDVNEITDRFVRGDSSRNTEGSGLGLAIAKSFIELQHGTLQITTEADLFKAEIVLPRLSEGQTGQTEV